MPSEEEIFDLTSLVKYLNERADDPFYRPIIDLISVHNASIGGCSCNRDLRIQNASNYFETKVLNADKYFLEEFKKILT